MFNREIIFNILSFLFIANVYGAQNKETSFYRDEIYRPHKPGSTEFDVLIFTQRWPQTVCFTWKENSESHTCALPKERDEWTIHGIWPTQYHKTGPQFCNKSMPFDRNVLKPLAQELEEKWIDIEYGRTSYSLWEHEWNKHGTCAVRLEKLDNQFKYFNEGLNLLSKYDMKNVLAKSHVLPGRAYTATTILNAINQALGKRGALFCRKSKNTGESYIFEIRICLDKALELIDCDGISEYPTNCDNVQSLKYPGEVPEHYHVVQV